MRRHAPNWTSLILGITFAAIAIAYLSAAIDDRTLQARWVLPILLIGLGVSGVAATVLRFPKATPPSAEDEDAPAVD
jgi:hypothetical protein